MDKGKTLKPSRFNFETYDKNGDLLMCNFSKGSSSFCRVLKGDIEKYKELINRTPIIYNGENFIDRLIEKGFLVSENLDENMVVDSLYYNAAMDSRLMLIVMPTEQCNFRCPYCYENYENGKMSNDSQKALLKFLQRKLDESSKLLIAWFGGEPLEAVDVVESIMLQVKTICEKKKKQYSSDMTTNAYNLTPEIFDKLYNLKIYRYQITLDGLKEQHNKQRILSNGEGTFDRIIENLTYIKNNKEYRFANITIRVNVTREIMDNLSAFIDFYKATFGEDKRFSVAFTPVNDMGGDSVKSLYSKFITPSDLYATFKKINVYEDKELNLSNILRAFSPTDGLCYASKKNTFVIGPNLNVYKCTVHFDLPENNIGKILPNGEMQINESLHSQWYINHTKKESCKSCFLAPSCFGGGCPHKRNFFDATRNKCVLSAWKKEIEHAFLYLPTKHQFEIIDFGKD